MKISIRKFDILGISLVILGLFFVLFTTYTTVALATNTKQSIIEREKIEEQENVVLTKEEQETLDLINEYRKENGLKDLKAISSLQEIAKLKAEDLVNNNYFEHTSETLGTPFAMLKNNGVDYYSVAGENLAGITTPERAVSAWIDSKSHRKNILNDEFEYTGIYVIDSEIYGKVYVQLFIGI